MISVLIFFVFFSVIYLFYSGFMYFSLLMFFSFFYYLFGFNFVGLLGFNLGGLFVLDYYSFLMIFLTLWLFLVVYMVYDGGNIGGFYMGLIFFFLVLSFLSSSIYLYYIFFESSLVPIFLLVLGLGTTRDRLVSGYYMVVYTMVSSIPALFVIMSLFSGSGYLSFSFGFYLGCSLSLFECLLFFFLFMVKIPIFIFHIWLPKAHVEAPVYGSMILASIMLKLGGYGLFRLFQMSDFNVLLVIFISLGLFGVFFISLYCFWVVDLKVLVAYSSVVHMCMMICGILSFSLVGYLGGFIVMLSHGICSSGMFMMVNYMYIRSFSRFIIFNKGFMGVVPLFSFFWLFIVMLNISIPPSFSMFGEIYSLLGVLSMGWYYFLFFVLGLFMISCYTLNMFIGCMGTWGGGFVSELSIKDYLLIMYHCLPLIVMFIYVSLMF